MAKSIGLTENIIDNTSYTIVIKNTLIFKLIIKYISFGSSFKFASNILNANKEIASVMIHNL